MNTEVQVETQEHFLLRMSIERSELGRELRDENYYRAWGIAQYISQEIAERMKLREEGKL